MEELPFRSGGFLPLDADPKLAWARENFAESPVEVNQAEIETLLRIPGIGKLGAERICNSRKERKLTDCSNWPIWGSLLNGQRHSSCWTDASRHIRWIYGITLPPLYRRSDGDRVQPGTIAGEKAKLSELVPFGKFIFTAISELNIYGAG